MVPLSTYVTGKFTENMVSWPGNALGFYFCKKPSFFVYIKFFLKNRRYIAWKELME